MPINTFGVKYSCFAIAGVDIPDIVAPLVKLIASFESIFAQLFMVILVGRMLVGNKNNEVNTIGLYTA